MNRQEGMASFFLIGSELRAAGVAIDSHRAAHLPLSLLAGYGSALAFATGKIGSTLVRPSDRAVG